MLRLLATLLPIVLAVYAVIDVTRSDEEERMGMHPGIWIVLIVVVPVLGSIVWIATSRSVRARRAPAPGSGRRSGPTAPDDDPEFLRRLDEQHRRDQGDQG